MNAADIATLTLRSLDGTKNIRDDISYDEETAVVTYKPAKIKNTKKIVYWKLPVSYCGDKVLILVESHRL